MNLLNLNKDINANPSCGLCQGTSIAKYVDMVLVPVGTSMKIGDSEWKIYEKSDICPNCFPYPYNHQSKLVNNEN